MRHNRLSIPGAALLVWVAAPAVEASAQIEVDTAAIELSGRLPLASGLSRGFRVTLDSLSEDTATIEILADDLMEVDGPSSRFIDRSNVSLAAPQLRKGVPVNATITVAGAEHPGTFTGRAVLRVHAHPEVTSDPIDITVKVLPSIALQLHVPPDGYERVSCSNRLSCALGSWLIHAAAVDSLFRVLVTNSANASVSLNRLRITMVGESSGQPHMPVDSAVTRNLPIGPEVLVYRFAPVSLQPGHYEGVVRADVEDSRVVVASAAFDVRLGPTWMLIVLFAGILVSRLLAKINRTGAAAGTATASERRVAKVPHALAGFSWEHKSPGLLVAALALLSGLPWAPNMTRRKFVEFVARALTTIVLIVAAASQGVETLYVGNPTFGEGPLLAYTSVFLWPFTADVLTRGLGNLKWPG